MKSASWIIALLIVAVLAGSVSAQVWVDPYSRKDGSSVPGHYRSNPDNNPYNNYGFPGNYNPNTGRTTEGNQEKYLERYNEPKANNPYGTSGPNPHGTTPRSRGLGW